MNADPTAARDRAMALVHPAIRNSSKFHAGYAVELAGEVIDALLAHPEVLRALAGAPTADVAEREWGVRYPSGLLVKHRSEAAARREVQMTTDPGVVVQRQIGPWTPATPEGVDAADEPSSDIDWRAAYDSVVGKAARAQHLADELTAAQAVIQRVRDLCRDRYELGHGLRHLVGVEDVLTVLPPVRALDGDTTEEQR